MPPDIGIAGPTATRADILSTLLKRDRLVIGITMALLVVLAALYTIFGVGMEMTTLEMTVAPDPGELMMMPAAWTPGYAVLVFLMWWVMMIAMMLPSAAPMVLLHAAVKRRSEPEAEVTVLTGLFVLGYLVIWSMFSAAAVVLQWGLELRGLVSPVMMSVTSETLGGVILVAAGIYQLTPLKHACLEHCRSPVHYLSRHHRPGRNGALRMGLGHGAYCLGCCWVLMALLFFGGIMNLYWIAGLAILVMVEKLMPHGHRLAQAAGIGLVIIGGILLAGAFASP